MKARKHIPCPSKFEGWHSLPHTTVAHFMLDNGHAICGLASTLTTKRNDRGQPKCRRCAIRVQE